MKLLLHTCCAPCMIYPAQRLREEKYEVTAFFYNPNIHPFLEYKLRVEAVKGYAAKAGLGVVVPEYLPQEFFRAVHLKEEAPERCRLCWSLRLKNTARRAREMGFEAITTTLLASPYQDQEAIRQIGREAAASVQVAFFYEDFRQGFHQAHNAARAQGIYCQKYCGCIHSEVERYAKPLKNK